MQLGVDAAPLLRSNRTGTERYAFEIVRHLLALPRAGDHQWLLYADQAVDPAVNAAVVAHQSPGGPVAVEWSTLPGRSAWTHRALGPAIVRQPPDVLFVPAHVIPFVLRRSQLPPCVVTVHDLGYRYFPELHTRRQRWYLDTSTRWSTAVATTVICVSQATATDLQRYYGTPAAKIRVIHEAVAPAPAGVDPTSAAAVRARWHLTRPFALFIGTIQPRKNIVRMLEAYASLLQTAAVGWDLVLAGRAGWLSEPIMARWTELGLENRVHLTGYISEVERAALLQSASFLCFPSLHEGFGLPILEAQQMGVPVVTANNSSLPEVAGNAALLVDPTDVDALAAAMLRLSIDEELRATLIAAGCENVKRFSWSKAAAETLNVLENAAKSA